MSLLESKRTVTQCHSGVTQFHLAVILTNHFACPVLKGFAVQNGRCASQHNASAFDVEALIKGKRKVQQEKSPYVSQQIAWLPMPYQATSLLPAWVCAFAHPRE